MLLGVAVIMDACVGVAVGSELDVGVGVNFGVAVAVGVGMEVGAGIDTVHAMESSVLKQKTQDQNTTLRMVGMIAEP